MTATTTTFPIDLSTYQSLALDPTQPELTQQQISLVARNSRLLFEESGVRMID